MLPAVDLFQHTSIINYECRDKHTKLAKAVSQNCSPRVVEWEQELTGSMLHILAAFAEVREQKLLKTQRMCCAVKLNVKYLRSEVRPGGCC
jgi:hypothetical protein